MISLRNVNKNFGAFRALADVNLEVKTGELVALLGPSGGGKSTILRIIAGLEHADSGEVWLAGKRVDGLNASERGVGFVFQHYALFRQMTVADNVGFGLSVRGAPKNVRNERVNELLRIVGLTGFENRYPHQLSGGQRQRVALARSLATAPNLLLLDEPFAAVDARVRAELRSWLRRLHHEMQVTSIFVTHDQDEAFAVADRVVVINAGGVEQIGSPFDILDQPRTEFVSRFIGEVNVFDASVENGVGRVGALQAQVPGIPDGEKVRLVIRSYDIKLWRDDAGGVASVRHLVPLGDRVRVDVHVDGAGDLFAHFPRRSGLLSGLEPGCRVGIEVVFVRAYPIKDDASARMDVLSRDGPPRASPRRERRAPVQWTARWSFAGGSTHDCEVLDLTSKGAFIVAPETLPQGLGVERHVKGQLKAGPDGKALEVAAIVRWTGWSERHQCAGFGVEFENVPPEVLELLRSQGLKS